MLCKPTNPPSDSPLFVTDDHNDASPLSENEVFVSQFNLDYALENENDDGPVSIENCECYDKPKGACPDYISYITNFVNQVFQSKKSNQDGLQKPLPYSKLVHSFWRSSLQNYFDGKSVADAVEYGWDLGICDGGPPLQRDWLVCAPQNHPSARHYPDQVETYLQKEQVRGVLVGPLPAETLPFPVFCSPLGTVEKPGSSTVRRVIVDSSYPKGRGVNSYIPKHFYRGHVVRTKLPTIDSIVKMVRNVKVRYPDSKLLGFKVDLDAYYRYINTNPGESPYQCFVWKDQLFLDLSWSFGLSSAVQAAQRQSEALSWVFRTQVPPTPSTENKGRSCHCLHTCSCGDNEMSPYIDDFISIVPEEHSEHLWDFFTRNVVGKSGLQLSKTPAICVPHQRCLLVLALNLILSEMKPGFQKQNWRRSVHLLLSGLVSSSPTGSNSKNFLDI